MKKLFLLLTFLFTYQFSMAQFSYGIKGGLNVATLSFSNEFYDTSPKIGFNLGAFGNYSLNEKLSIQPELYYSAEGNKWTFENDEATGVIKTSQFRLPILLKNKVGEKLSIEVGPQFNIPVSMKQSIDDDEFENIKEFYKTVNIGFAIGATYDLGNILTGLAAGIRYNGGFGKINNESVGGEEIRSNVLQLNVFYTLSK